AAHVERARIVRRYHDRDRPLKAILRIRCVVPHRVVRPRIHIPAQSRVGVEASEQTAVRSREHYVRRIRTNRDVAALAAANVVPVIVRDSAFLAARAAQRGSILLRATNAIREVGGRLDVIELSACLVFRSPRLAAVIADRRATVVRFDHSLGVVRCDPQIVIVAVRNADRLVCLSPVGRVVEADVGYVNAVLVLGVCEDARVVPGALAQTAAVVDLDPRGARVVGAKYATGIGFDYCPQVSFLCWRRRDSNVADYPLGKARIARDLGPVLTRICGLEDPAAGAAGNELPRLAVSLPESRIQYLRILRVD